jgi:hypothetical protein
MQSEARRGRRSAGLFCAPAFFLLNCEAEIRERSRAGLSACSVTGVPWTLMCLLAKPGPTEHRPDNTARRTDVTVSWTRSAFAARTAPHPRGLFPISLCRCLAFFAARFPASASSIPASLVKPCLHARFSCLAPWHHDVATTSAAFSASVWSIVRLPGYYALASARLCRANRNFPLVVGQFPCRNTVPARLISPRRAVKRQSFSTTRRGDAAPS